MGQGVSMQSNASHWLPTGVNPPCTCQGHSHRSDAEGHCDRPNDNDPESWGYCGCQHDSRKPVTADKYSAWQADIRAGKLGPDDRPEDLGFEY